MEDDFTMDDRWAHIEGVLGPYFSGNGQTGGESSSASDLDAEPQLIDLNYVREEVANSEHQALAAMKLKKSKKSSSSRSTYAALPPSSCEPDPVKAQQLLKETFPRFQELEVGELSEVGMTFVSWDLVVRYPQLFIGNRNRPKAAPLFEDTLNGHTWDFFYLYNPKNLAARPKLFVPTQEFSHFLQFINATLGIVLTIPEGEPGENFMITFGAGDTPRPRYLGRSVSQSDFVSFQDRFPPADDQDVCARAAPADIESLLAKLTLNVKPSQRKKNGKIRKQKEAAEERKESLHLVQRCMQLRPVARGLSDSSDSSPPSDAHGVDTYMGAVFAAIDIEVAEQSHTTILEVGISTLDSRRVAGIAPGDAAQNWLGLIQSHHLRVYDYRFMCNTKYVRGCPDSFNFGASEMPMRADLAKRVLAILSDCTRDDPDRAKTPEGKRQRRPLIIVGHGITADLGFLANMNVDVAEIKGFVRCIDTQDMDQCWRGLTNSRSLGTVLNDLHLAHSNLHNAGNDAAYTLQAMLAIAVRARASELDAEKIKT